MNQTSAITLFLICAITGSILMVKTLMDSRNIYMGEETSLRKILINSFYFGLSVSMIFMAVILFVGVNDQSYTWSFQGIIISVSISLCGGLIVLLGSLWSFFLIGKYRDILYRKLEKGITKKKK